MPKRISGKKSVDELVKKARKQGWHVRQNANAHWTFIPPDKEMRIVVCAKQPGCWHAVKNMRRDLKNSGLVV